VGEREGNACLQQGIQNTPLTVIISKLQPTYTLVCQSANSVSIKILSVDQIWPMLDSAHCLKNRYTGKIFTLFTGSTVLHFTATGAPLAARCIRIFPVNQHA
jgi:hypothetical protein